MADASSGWLCDVAEELRLLEQDELCYGIQAASDPREEVDEPETCCTQRQGKIALYLQGGIALYSILYKAILHARR